jgi:hypothetical protein
MPDSDDDDSDESRSDYNSEDAAGYVDKPDAGGDTADADGDASAGVGSDADHPEHNDETGAEATTEIATQHEHANGEREDTSEEDEATSEEDEDAHRTTGLISDEDDGPNGNADQTTGEDPDADTTTEEAAAHCRRPARNHFRLPAALKRWHDVGTVIAVWASETSASSWWLARLTHDVDLEGGNAHMQLPLQWLTTSPPVPLPQGVTAQFQLESSDCDCTPARTVLLSLPPMASPEMTYDLITDGQAAIDCCIAASSAGSDDRRGGPQYSPSTGVSLGTWGTEELDTRASRTTGAGGQPGRPNRSHTRATEQTNTLHDFFQPSTDLPTNSTAPTLPSAASSPGDVPRHFWQTVCLHIPALAHRTQTDHGRLVPKLSEQTAWTNGSEGLDMIPVRMTNRNALRKARHQDAADAKQAAQTEAVQEWRMT